MALCPGVARRTRQEAVEAGAGLRLPQIFFNGTGWVHEAPSSGSYSRTAASDKVLLWLEAGA